MLHYTELLVKSEHRPQFSFQTCLLADALREGGKWHFGWASHHLPHRMRKTRETLLQELRWSNACFTLTVPKSGWGRAALRCPVTYD